MSARSQRIAKLMDDVRAAAVALRDEARDAGCDEVTLAQLDEWIFNLTAFVDAQGNTS